MQRLDFQKQKKTVEVIQQKSQEKRNSSLIRHTHIYHEAREKLGLSIIEYCVAAVIRTYEGGKESRENYAWVFASKETIAQCLGVSKRTIERAITVLLKKELIEKNSTTKHLRTTESWIKEIDYWKQIRKKTG